MTDEEIALQRAAGAILLCQSRWDTPLVTAKAAIEAYTDYLASAQDRREMERLQNAYDEGRGAAWHDAHQRGDDR